ncbi:HNH endonuclease family protein [Paracoccus pantotrophus]|uniref:HNH endonuclease family protein n=1 Tax=Paracoccus pantotrophus TaxID=82367 RepID=UPI00147487C8|nr:HNH endonuclease family protein [Paracoccus pantotrophus]
MLDIANTTLEHIYPQKLDAKDRVAELEPVKHALGNLTILGPGENDAAANKSFPDKRKAFEESNLRINRQIAKNMTWTKADVDKRTGLLAEIAEKIFVP